MPFDRSLALSLRSPLLPRRADDLGYGDLSVYGNAYSETPNLDRLAREGTMFMRGYVNAITCCPSRAALMSGRYPWRFSTRGGYIGDYGFPLGQKTLTSILQDSGYRTMHAGKWHIGPDDEDGTYGIDSIIAQGQTTRNRALYPKDEPLVATVMGMLEEGSTLGEQPFYIQMWSKMTHNPVTPPDILVRRYRNLAIDTSRLRPGVLEKLETCSSVRDDPLVGLRIYIAELFGFDQGVGQVLARMDELELNNKTVVIFTSDHGSAPVRATDDNLDRCNLMGCAGPFIGGKHDLTEGGLRVPMIVRWPGRIRQNFANTNSQFSFVDFLPTITAMAQVPRRHIPDDTDGIDMSAAWFGSEDFDFRDGNHLCWQSASRSSWHWVTLWNSFKLVQLHRRSSTAPYVRMMYDVESDPTEAIDLYGTSHTIVDARFYGTSSFSEVEEHMVGLLLACQND